MVMKRTSRRILSLVLTIAIVFSVLASFVFTADAATYVYNTGKRGVVCTSLSSRATAYYTGNYTYDKISSQTASTAKSTLKTLMTSTQTKVTSYNEIRTLSKYSDSTAGSTTKMTLLYTSNSVNSAWDNGVTWNREHVWCQSLGTFTTSNCGSDLHHLRPADPRVNSTRCNLPYGEVTNGTYSTAKTSAGTVGGYYTSKYFEPLDNVKGDVARILLYVYVRWGENNITDLCQSTDMLLQWMKDDPVDTWEMGRNDAVQSIEGNRNVFIDYPELAWTIFGKSVPSDMTTPSGKASTSTGTGSGSGSGSASTYTVSWGKSSSSTGSGTISVTANGASISSGASVASGSTMKVTLTPATGSKASSLTLNGSAVTLSNNTYSFTLSKNTSLLATWQTTSSGSGSTATGTTYTKVTSAPSNWKGDYVLIGVSNGKYYVLNANASVTGTNIGGASGAIPLENTGITMSGSTLSNVPTNYVYTCAAVGSYYSFKMKNSGNYLTYKSKGLTTSTSSSGTAAQWSLSMNGQAVKMRSRSASTYYLGFNASSKYFRCYTSTTTYKLYLYKVN